MILLSLASVVFAGPVDRVPADYPTIQAAIDQGSAPVIEVGPGQWHGATVTRTVALQADPGAVIVSGPRGKGFRYGIGLTGDADGTTISGFTFDCRSRDLHLGVYGSRVRMGGAADNVLVSNNVFRGCTQGVTNAGSPQARCDAERVDGGAYWVIENNRFAGLRTRGITAEGGGIGVYLFNVTAADVVENTFGGTVRDNGRFATAGVAVAGCQDCVIAANRFAVQGAHTWTAVNNLGASMAGAASSRGLLITDNDASLDSAPVHGLSFLSWDSFATTVDRNNGAAWVDHTWCGDGETSRR